MTSNEPQAQKAPPPEKVRFSIGAKLITITFIVLVLSLGSVTALVSWLVHRDLRILAEETNFEVNRRSAQEAQSILQTKQANAALFARAGGQEPSPQETNFFFAQNPAVAALFVAVAGQDAQIIGNTAFFEGRLIDPALAASFAENQREALDRAALGESLILNASPWFGIPMLALYFPFPGDGAVGVAAIFSAESLNEAFGFGANQSFLINDMGDILVHTDIGLVMNAANVAGRSFTRYVWDNPLRNAQTVFTDEEGTRFLRAFTKLGIAGGTVITNIEYDLIFDSFAATIRRNIYLAAVVLSLSLLLVWFFAKRISVSLKALTSATNKIESGSFKTDLRSKRSDELGVLISSFQRMSGALEKFNQAIENRPTAQQSSAQQPPAHQVQVQPPAQTQAAAEAAAAAEAKKNDDYAQSVFKVKLAERAGREKLALQEERTRQAELALQAEISRQKERALQAELALEEELARQKELARKSQASAAAAEKEELARQKSLAEIRALQSGFKVDGQARLATVFFSSINEFATKSEAYTRGFPDEAAASIVRCLNNYFSHMVKCIEKTKGVVDKFIGDALLAYWGMAPAGTPEKDAFNCITTALMMRKTLYKINKKRKPGVPAIHIGCGINSGIVTAGAIGFNSKKEYTILGDPVNVASKIKALAKPLGVDILIGEETWQLINNYFITEEMPPMSFGAGKKSMRIFAVVNFSGINKGPQTLEEVREMLGIGNSESAEYANAKYAKAAVG
ncbi:MAG: adenylate/guanylate cyclase domain-containing protein [Spirochaetes bacterium]|nr:adenylate/guanylate cyclase domain-containing protein [Spirochaetota bacterium]